MAEQPLHNTRRSSSLPHSVGSVNPASSSKQQRDGSVLQHQHAQLGYHSKTLSQLPMQNDVQAYSGQLGLQQDSSKLGAGQQSDQKEDIIKALGRVLILQVVDGKYRAPVVTLNNNDTGSVYTVVEKHLRQEYLVGSEKFWKIIRNDHNLETWRPRVHGTQLKALLNCRLPEQEPEFQQVAAAVASLQHAFKPESKPDVFVSDLRKFISAVEIWWDNRNSRRAEGAPKRPNPSTGATPSASAGTSSAAAAAAPSASNRLPKKPMTQYPAGSHQQHGAPSQQQAGPSGNDQQYYPTQQQQPNSPYGAPSGAGGVPQGGRHPMFAMPGDSQQQQQQQQQQQPNRYYQPPGFAKFPGAGQHFGSGPHGFDIPGSEPGSKDSPEDMAYGNGGPAPGADLGLVQLNVGGTPYTTLATTLLSVPHSFFWGMLHGSAPEDMVPRTASGEFFIDRNGKMFYYVLEYLRACSQNDASFPLPDDPKEVMALAREAEYFNLPGLLDRLQSTAIMPQPGTRAMYDSLYLETGFNSIEGPKLKQMEQRKVVVMQQMNHVLTQKSADGFYVEACDCGVNHREGPEGGMEHNLYYHILLKKVVPVLPQARCMMGGNGGV